MMYLGHFHLREAPFSITPDTDFFYPHEEAQAALNMLLVALRNGEGFLKIVGEVGCGKTILCRQLLKTLDGEFVTAYIPNPSLGPDTLLMALLHELGVEVPPPLNRDKVFNVLRNCLLAHAAAGRRVVVCIDEAQATPLRTLESLRLLSNLETEKQKLLQLVLLGQPELDDKLSRPEIRQLLQRITFSAYLGPMRADRVSAYLEHRLTTAALGEATDTQVFHANAAKELAHLSGGVPRLVNLLANKCLMLAYGEKMRRVSLQHVRMAAADTPGVRVRGEAPWWKWEGVWRSKRPGDPNASNKQLKHYFFRRFTVSVVNKMLRDIDSRRSPDKQPLKAGEARTGMESDTVIVNDSHRGERSTGSLSAGTILTVAVIVLAGSVGPWWYLNESGFLQRNLEPTTAINPPVSSPAPNAELVIAPSPTPATTTPESAQPTAATETPPVDARLSAVTPSPMQSSQIDATGMSPVSPDRLANERRTAVEPLVDTAVAPTPASSDNFQPKASIETPPVAARLTAVAPSSGRLSQTAAISTAPAREAPVKKRPVAVAPVMPAAAAVAAPQPEQARSPVLEALAQAQSLWLSGSRQASMSLLREALAVAERANPVGLPSADHSELVLLARELARTNLILGQPGPALALLRRLEPALFGFADVWAVRGNAAQRLGRHQESATAYLMALKLRPNEPRWMLGAAVSLAAQGKIGKATELAEKARIGGVLSVEVAAYLRQLGVNLSER
jgi:MSHA biogenesis protein MshM